MTIGKKLGWVICAAMVVASGVAYLLTPHTLLADTLPAVNLEKDFPSAFGHWKLDPQADVSIPNPQTEGVIKSIYTDTLTRVYVSDTGKQVFLSVAYGKNQSDGHGLHYPEVCYPAQGFLITSTQAAQIRIDSEVVPAKHLVAARGEQMEPITYWATVGRKIILSGTAHKVAQLEYGFRGYIPDGLIIRVSSIGTDAPGEYETQRQFLESLVNALRPEVRSRVLGELSAAIQ
jgi:EpsI family protein